MEILRLFQRHWDGMSDPRNGSDGRPDYTARWLLYGIPVLLAALALILKWDLAALAPSLLAAYALAASVLVAAFAQLASWRSALDSRARSRPLSEAAARRSVGSSVAHTLMGVLYSLLALLGAVVMEMISDGQDPFTWPERLASCFAVLTGSLVVTCYVVIVRGLWIGYEATLDDDVEDEDRKTLRRSHTRG